ncbi:MAG: DNA repair protein RecN [candidate division Zixibacteria bacterium]|nr:DNA repair protein RecN [candidate division Zixibacteria bacterium]
MIETLHINNYALIEDLTIEFKPGLNIFTGSTGAGKTIIIGALGLAFGERASEEAIRTGAKAAIIETEVSCVTNNDFTAVEFVNPDSYIIRREIKKDGRSRAFIDNRQVTLTNLKEIGGNLADITGQHRQKGLTDPTSHIQIIDIYAHLENENDELSRLFRKNNNLKSELSTLQKKQDDWAAEKELLEFQIKEIELASLEEDEDKRLEQEKLQLVNAEKIKSVCRICENSLFTEDGSASERIKSSIKELDRIVLFSDKAESLKNKLNELSIILDESGISIREMAESFEYDSGRLEIVEDRLVLIKKLKRKYGQNINEITQYCENAKVKVGQYEDINEALARLTKDIVAHQIILSEKAQAISAARRKAAAKLEKQVVKHLTDLAMKGADFKVKFMTNQSDSGPYLVEMKNFTGDETGFDIIEFLICPNPGEKLKPLASTASGGELSRLMLAIISALIDSLPRETLVFDEIDTGISGEVASQVGKKLQKLAKNSQVICITHLQQIASRGETHFKVYKGKSKGRSVTKIKMLEGDQRVAEIARLLAGEKISEIALDGANQLLQEGRS